MSNTRRAVIEAGCAVTTDAGTIALARWATMEPGGRAQAHLDHYVNGFGTDMPVDLSRLLSDDGGVRGKVDAEIVQSLRDGKISGTVAIPQRTYRSHDWKFAIGSMNINWTFPSSLDSTRVHVGFRNEYRWHPDDNRDTKCVHEAAEALKKSGARDYWMEGSAEILLPVRFHRVALNETLSRIARQYYGRADRWPELHAANRLRIANPDLLRPGLVLEVP